VEKMIRTGTIPDSLYSTLRRNIINLNLAPGTGISEKEIALKFKVSRTPVREAFIHLAKEGLVKVVPQKETLVSLVDLARVEQEFFLRESLEMAVLEPFIQKAKSEHFKTLEELVESQNAAIGAEDYIQFLDSDDDFHRVFFEAAGQELSWDVLQNMSGHYHRVRMMSIRLNGIASGVVGQHKKILGAFKKKDAAAARDLLRQHLDKIGSEEKLLRDEFPGYFAEEGFDVFNIDFGSS
jgi:DNA-binding GntR family transcriptional regulator